MFKIMCETDRIHVVKNGIIPSLHIHVCTYGTLQKTLHFTCEHSRMIHEHLQMVREWFMNMFN